MYCVNCGKQTPDNGKFCQSCGIEIKTVISGPEETGTDTIQGLGQKNIGPKNFPYPYVVPLSKLAILSVTTFGIYEIYWFYKQWKSIKAERNLKAIPWLNALFSTLTSYFLFKNVSQLEKTMDAEKGFSAGAFALLYFITSALWRLPEWYWLLSLFTFIPLIVVQDSINFYWKKKFGSKVEEAGYTKLNVAVITIGAVILLLSVWGSFIPDEDSAGPSSRTTTEIQRAYNNNSAVSDRIVSSELKKLD